MSWQDKFYQVFEKSISARNGIELVRFTDGVGYSIVGEYPKRYKQLMRVPRERAFKPMYKFAAKVESDLDDYIPLYISAALTLETGEEGHKRYILSYGKIKGITPVDFSSVDEFFISKDSGELSEKIGNTYKKIDPMALFKRVERAHFSKLSDFRAVRLRMQIFILRKFPSYIFSSITFCSGILTWILEGKRFQYDVLEVSFREGLGSKREEKSTPEPKEQIDFFGYKVSIWTLFTFSILVLVTAFISGHYKLLHAVIFTAPPGPFLTIAIAIVAIVIYDNIAPYLLKALIKSLEIKSFNLKNKGVRLKI